MTQTITRRAIVKAMAASPFIALLGAFTGSKDVLSAPTVSDAVKMVQGPGGVLSDPKGTTFKRSLLAMTKDSTELFFGAYPAETNRLLSQGAYQSGGWIDSRMVGLPRNYYWKISFPNNAVEDMTPNDIAHVQKTIDRLFFDEFPNAFYHAYDTDKINRYRQGDRLSTMDAQDIYRMTTWTVVGDGHPEWISTV
jgi:hypothetical protein